MQILVASLAVILALLVAALVRSFSRPVLESEAARLAVTLRLPIAPNLLGFITRRTAIRLRAIRIGQVLGMAAGVVLVLVIRPTPQQGIWLVLACFLAAWMTALCVASLMTLEAPRPAGVARASAVELTDYVAPTNRVVVGVAIGAAVVIVVVALRLSEVDLPTWIALALSAVSFVVAELAARRLVSQRQPSDSDLELAWNDALRAQVVRDLYGLPATFAVLAILLAVLGIAGPGASDNLLPVLSLSLVVVSLIVSRVSKKLELDRYVLRRLWPTQARAGWTA